jgi:excisionase family DNA binding protein
MNAAVNSLYTEYLDHTGGDKAAAASLTLAAVLMEERAPQPDTALTVPEAAKRLKIAPNTVYLLVERGELQHHRIGRTIRIMPADIDAYQQQAAKATRPRFQRGTYQFNL